MQKYIHTLASPPHPSPASFITDPGSQHPPHKRKALQAGCWCPSSSFPLPLLVLWCLGHQHPAPRVSGSRCPQLWRAECEPMAGPLHPASGWLPVKAASVITKGPGGWVGGQNPLSLSHLCYLAVIVPEGQAGQMWPWARRWGFVCFCFISTSIC